MFLKKLEVQGFKSFPEKIKLNFKEGVTAVVGPNGSGKSNISDAIRWVLGEQSAKSLRGDKMEDIIFAGTKNRKALGFAEVSMTLDNSDKKLNIDFTEVTVTRKVYRSGESGYYINGASCRLKDIHELFMDTGIGKEGYSIIGQGKIDAILSNKSEERRAIFEEAVGIIKFKNRRIQTENKLEEVRQNLTRTNDIISELERQLKPLEIQEKKAREYIILAEDLKLVSINLFKDEYKRGEIEIEKINDYIKNLQENAYILENEKTKIEQEQEQSKQKLAENEENVQKLNNEISKSRLNIEQEDNNIKLNFKNIEFIKNDILRIEKEFSYFEESLKNKENEIDILKTSLDGKNLEYSIKKSNLDEILKEFESIREKTDKNEETIRGLNNKIVEKMSLSAEINNKISLYESSKKQYSERKSQIDSEKNVFNSRLNEKNTRKKVLQKTMEQIKEKEIILNNDIAKKNILIQNIEKLLFKIREEYNLKSKTFTEFKQKEKILMELEKDYEGYFNSVKAILKEKEKNPKFSEIYGVVGELISVPKKYETAIEIALGGAVQNIITKNEEQAKMAINYLKETKNGRATFLPLTSIKSKPLNNIDILKQEKGFIGIADEIIKFDEIFKNVISSLLGRTIIMDSIDNAITFSKKYNYSYKIVTLDGELINAGGSLTGGSVFKKSAGIFSRSRELQDIKISISNLQNEIQKLENKTLEKENEKEKILSGIEIQNQNLKELFEEKTFLKTEIAQNEAYILEFLERIKSIEKENETLNIQLNFQDESKLSDEFNNINKEIEELKQELLNFETNLQKEKSYKDFRFNEINELKLTINSIENDIENIEKDIARINDEIEQIKKKQSNFKKEIAIKENEKNNLHIKIEEKNNIISNIKLEYEKLQKNFEKIQEEKTEIAQKIDSLVAEVLEIIKKIGDLNNEITKAEGKKENIESKIERFSEIIWQDYEITYAEACNEYKDLGLSYDELKLEEKSLKSKISSLGTINVGAIEEYKNVKERYELNISQRDDILKADDDLKNIIFTLIKEMEQQFKDQFQLINKNFKEVFSSIFGGGTAKLTLTDEENILTSGIEIVAQPPGKNLQSLTLLSGGERTLTAISLLFAILKIKPSPFCILDETEAALDDANVTRYANFLKRFSENNQFILITHKTGTMEIADVLYGVTMEEQGVSKVISVELKEAKDYQKK